VLNEAGPYRFGTQIVSRDVALALKTIGYEEPTRIQSDCIGPLLAGNDVVGQAHTGTGKTAAFGIPLVEQADPSQVFIQGLILVPTRELAMQVRDELVRLAQFRRLGVVACYGGQPISKQIAALKRRTHIVVGTPGRVLDHLGKGTLRLETVRTVVLDEADEMLDVGFLPDIERILSRTPRNRQTALFCATMPSLIRRIVGRHMRSPVWIRIGSEIETSPDVRQVYIEVLEQDRVRAFVRLLKTQVSGGKVLMFRRTKVGVDNLAQALQRQGIAAAGIHGGLVQSERNAAMRSFHAGELKVLVATNLAARGLDGACGYKFGCPGPGYSSGLPRRQLRHAPKPGRVCTPNRQNGAHGTRWYSHHICHRVGFPDAGPLAGQPGGRTKARDIASLACSQKRTDPFSSCRCPREFYFSALSWPKHPMGCNY